MKKYKGVLSLFFLCSLLLTGCWSQKELNDLAIISALGVDGGENGKRYTVTLQVINPANVAGGMEGGGETEAPPISTYQASGDNMFEVNRMATARLPRRRYYAHTNLVVLSEELVRKEGLATVLDGIERHPEFRMTANIVIVRDAKASEFLNVLTRVDKIPAQKVIKNLRFTAQQWGESVVVNLQTVVKDLTSAGKEPVISGFEISGDYEKGKKLENIQTTDPDAGLTASGLGLFKDGKLVDWLDDETARGVVWILDKIQNTGISIDYQDKKKSVVYSLIRQSTKVIPKIKNGRPEVHIKVETEGSIEELLTSFIDLTDPHELLKIEKVLAKEIEKELRLAVEEVQKRKADVFGFGQSFYRSYPEVWGKWEDEWHDVYFPELKVEITADVYIRRTGLRNKPKIVNEEA
ncbi:Ger(x)C family spore germination protein [Bacillus sp. B15-48]|uniref:Ger(x)C family spore germination protein n=1 Tax=Bacillus sp. B15-48 TaxID=1548601 RepID=UPI00193F85C7|nr:Ger(x)C family spore germination protein [Bacillus sp. B15-48]MBM4760979.1 Ger(x)C family spore germination protein [Bacillus sp. B15-48]